MARFIKSLTGLAAVSLALVAASGTGRAAELAATYFTVVERGDPDFNTTGCCVFPEHLVQSTLGPTGLPLISPAYRGPGLSGYAVHDVNESGEITWWTARSTVRPTGTGFTALPIENDHFFPPNGTGPDNAHGFQTGIFKGILHVPTTERVHFRIGADDVALLYLNGALVAELGGVHPRVDLPVITKTLRPGDYCLALFYADLYPDHAKLFFSVETTNVTLVAGVDTDATTSSSRCTVPVS
jgi:hypothetical protein